MGIKKSRPKPAKNYSSKRRSVTYFIYALTILNVFMTIIIIKFVKKIFFLYNLYKKFEIDEISGK